VHIIFIYELYCILMFYWIYYLLFLSWCIRKLNRQIINGLININWYLLFRCLLFNNFPYFSFGSVSKVLYLYLQENPHTSVTKMDISQLLIIRKIPFESWKPTKFILGENSATSHWDIRYFLVLLANSPT